MNGAVRPLRKPVPSVSQGQHCSCLHIEREASGPQVPIGARGEKAKKPEPAIPMAAEEDLLLKSFLAEVSEVERDNEVVRSQFLFSFFFFSLYHLRISSIHMC